MTDTTKKRPRKAGRLWLRRVGWLVGLWVASISVLALVAYGLRLLMNAAGLTA